MGELMSVLVTELVDGFQFDVDSPTALRLLNRRHKAMVRRARLRAGTVALGVTVAGQRDYDLGDVIEVLDLQVNGVNYDRAPRRAQSAYAQGQLSWWPSDVGLFVDTAGAAGSAQLGLIPTPTEAGLAIVVYGHLEAPTLGLADEILMSDDYVDALVGAAAATLYVREPEQQQTAAGLEAAFVNACDELRRQAAKQKRGAGPARIRLSRS